MSGGMSYLLLLNYLVDNIPTLQCGIERGDLGQYQLDGAI